MLLVDSSVWIDFFRGRNTTAVDQLSELLDEAAAPVANADRALFEILRGFRHERDYVAVDRVTRALDVVMIGGDAICRGAAQHYRELRARGVTIASPIDVLQATYCIELRQLLTILPALRMKTKRRSRMRSTRMRAALISPTRHTSPAVNRAASCARLTLDSASLRKAWPATSKSCVPPQNTQSGRRRLICKAPY